MIKTVWSHLLTPDCTSYITPPPSPPQPPDQTDPLSDLHVADASSPALLDIKILLKAREMPPTRGFLGDIMIPPRIDSLHSEMEKSGADSKIQTFAVLNHNDSNPPAIT